MTRRTVPRNVETIAENQVRVWLQQRRECPLEQHADPRPVIALSRQCGAQGAAIGRRVADILHFSFWDKELVAEITRRSGVEQELLASLDEKARSRLEEFLSETLMGPVGTSAEVTRQISRVIRTLQSHGSAVIVGRGATFLVPTEHALRVRVVAPFERRVQHMTGSLALSWRDGERLVRQTDREREVFLRRNFGVDATDPVHYDVVINTAAMGVEAAADIVLAAYNARFGEATAQVRRRA